MASMRPTKFYNMSSPKVSDKGNGAPVENLEDCRRVMVGPKSTDGRPIIEIQRPDGKRASDKIRYN